MFPLVLALAHSACYLEQDEEKENENIFLQRMPGTWELDLSLTEILAPSTWQDFDVGQLILTRDDSNVENFLNKCQGCSEECDKDDFPLIMTGLAVGTNLAQNETTDYGEN